MRYLYITLFWGVLWDNYMKQIAHNKFKDKRHCRDKPRRFNKLLGCCQFCFWNRYEQLTILVTGDLPWTHFCILGLWTWSISANWSDGFDFFWFRRILNGWRDVTDATVNVPWRVCLKRAFPSYPLNLVSFDFWLHSQNNSILTKCNTRVYREKC